MFRLLELEDCEKMFAEYDERVFIGQAAKMLNVSESKLRR
jgi:hypothetical protein